MLLVTALCLILAVLVMRSRRNPEQPNSSRLYRIDNRVIASVLVILAVAFAVLAVASGRLLL
ncbi:MAG TPA: hypothetical protein VHA11_15510 [Bryobacteraceae bacterium]|nr:hypothetical protein [Bryobacteraceae bacterium]